MQYLEEILTKALEDEVEPLIQAHHLEVGRHKDYDLDINWPLYELLCREHLLKIFTARDHGGLAGYLLYTLNPSLQYKQITQAQMEVLYVCPKYRGVMVGSRLIGHADKVLKLLNIDYIYQYAPVENDFSRLLERQGYRYSEKIYMKRLAS